MKQLNISIIILLYLVLATNSYGIPPENRGSVENKGSIDFRNDCLFGITETDLNINNVRARLGTSGDIWWDKGGSRAGYIVPKPSDPTVAAPASIYSGGVWLGGYDGAGNLKTAISDFPRAQNRDFFTGPLTEDGRTDRETCRLWDRFWVVYLDEILEFRQAFLKAEEEGRTLPLDSVPESLLKWPGVGNPYFEQYNGFPLPTGDLPLAGFYKHYPDDELIYDPLRGDLPAIEIRGCPITPDQIPDMMVFWIYNDAGNVHTALSNPSEPFQMEIQAQAFSYQTGDQVNDMSFIRYKLLNRAAAPITSTYFAMWVDPDLGCSDDDYIGSDTTRSLAYIYNSDAVDGTSGTSCGTQITYGYNIPTLGVDYFRGPLADSIIIEDGIPQEVEIELGMSSFMYYDRTSTNPNMQDPSSTQQAYNYLTGKWRDGTPLTFGGNGYNPEGTPTKYAFSSQPNDINGWSMCSENLTPGDPRTIQASGPFTLNVGRINELIVGVVWVPDQSYPCPAMDELFAADDKAQALFDNCFDIIDGPDAPDLSVIELDREVVFTISNANFPASNNQDESYEEVDTYAPTHLSEESRKYRFQGYKIYQLISSEVGRSELGDPTKARLVLQMDVKDSISKIYNWIAVPGIHTGQNFVVPELMVDGTNEGIKRTFRITNDAFAVNDVKLVNQKKYYYLAIAYAHNEYLAYNPEIDTIYQPSPYLEGRRNIAVYTVTPRKSINYDLNASYGDGVVVTRLDGKGNPMKSLVLTEESKKAVEDFENFNGELTYEIGTGPLDVLIYNPIDVQNGEFVLKMMDDNLGDDNLDENGYWVLRNLDTGKEFVSDQPLSKVNEQLIREYGFSITASKGNNPGYNNLPENGVVGSSITFENLNDQWLRPINNTLFRLSEEAALGFLAGTQELLFSRLDNQAGGNVESVDPDRHFDVIANQHGFTPFLMNKVMTIESITPTTVPKSSWSTAVSRQNITTINNVDIVLTSDKNLWSRCVVVETTHGLITAPYKPIPQDPMRVKQEASVSKEVDIFGIPIREQSVGFSWFPGYAIDVETGQRLNIFFGEASAFSGTALLPDSIFHTPPTGNDMIWNPTSDELIKTPRLDIYPPILTDYVLGGHHHIYVTRTAYDECATLATQLNSTSVVTNRNAFESITWAGMVMLQKGSSLKSYQDGLIPTETRISLRVGKESNVSTGTAKIRDGHPEYYFKIDGKTATVKTGQTLSEALDLINVVPNPYYATSDYEVVSNLNIVKITNLPYNSEVNIYTLNGDFVRKFERDLTATPYEKVNTGITHREPGTNIEWDMNNAQGIPIASGVYLIHVKTPNDGERVIKWLCVNRPFDSSTF